MNKVVESILSVWRFYLGGFRQMTWGRGLWVLILLKLFIIFVVLRLFFFHPALGGMSDSQKAQKVGDNLITNTK